MTFKRTSRSRDDDETTEIRAEIVRETERAFLLDFGGNDPEWFPKSQVTDNGHGTFEVPVWLAKEKGAV